LNWKEFWKEAVAAYYRYYPGHLPAEAEENHSARIQVGVLANTRMKRCVTEPCFRSVDMKLMGSGLSWFRIDDVLPFSVNTKLLLLFVFTTFETPIRRLEDAVILVTHLSCLKSIRICIFLLYVRLE